MTNDRGVTATELRYAIALTVAPKDLARLKRLDFLQHGHFAPHLVTSTYYDTPDLALKDRALALSVRQHGRQLVETLEGVDRFGGGTAETPVWQTPVTRAAPDLAPLAKIEAVREIAEAKPRLRPLFTCQLRRTRTVFEPEGAAVALSFDEGMIRTRDGRKLAVLEVELQLEQGGYQAVFDLARALSTAASMRVELRSTAARGYELAARKDAAEPPATVRYGRVRLDRRMSAEEALAAILRRCLAHMLVNDQAARVGEEEGVHQMRVALRRLRVALNLFHKLLPEEQRAWILGEVRWLTDRLGKARNWDVFGILVARVRDAFPEDDDIKMLAQAINHERRGAYGALRKVLASRRYTQFSLGLMSIIETRAWRRPGALETSILQVSRLGHLADSLIEERYRKARKRAKQFVRLGAQGRHKLRIALKKMRYAADSFEAIYGRKQVRKYEKRLEALQDDLGLLNDIVTAEKLIRSLPKPTEKAVAIDRAAALVRGWCGHLAAACEPRLDKRLKRFRAAKPFWRRPAKA
ncbi:MAG TPA: CHAD domain-containing protein [Stellaceae bacterium]|nr:CHAD domain-containing protein [Stellaceae bacterium]